METKNKVQDLYKLTPMQEGILFHSLYEKSSSTYCLQTSFTLEGKVDAGALESSLQDLFARHTILRTAFVHEGEKSLLQVVLKERNVRLRTEDVSGLPGAQQEAYLRGLKAEDTRRGFDLTKDVLMRFTLVTLGNELHEFIWTWHHILADGWSIYNILKEMMELYMSKRENRAPVLERTTPFRKYIQWIENQNRDEAGKFWQGYLADYDRVASIIPVSPGHRPDMHKESVYLTFDGPLAGQIKRLTNRHMVTFNSFFRTVWGILLAKYTLSRDVVFGVVVSGRPPELENVESMVGIFACTVPCRVSYTADTTFGQLLVRTQAAIVECNQHAYFPLVEIQRLARLPRLFDHVFVYDNYLRQQHDTIPDRHNSFSFKSSHNESFEQTHYDLEVSISDEDGQRVGIALRYNSFVVDPQIIEGVKRSLVHLVEQVVGEDEVYVDRLRLIDPEKDAGLAACFRGAANPSVDDDGTVLSWFYQQVAHKPGHMACIMPGRTISYRELNDRSDRVAHFLEDLRLPAESIVGVIADNGIEVVVAMVGIMKANLTFLPVGPDLPNERIAYMATDSNCRLLITQESYLPKANQVQGVCSPVQYVLCLAPGQGSEQRLNVYRDGIAVPTGPAGTRSAQAPLPRVSPSHAAYVLYTSGTTGAPKGVLVEYDALKNYLISAIDGYIGIENANLPLYSSLSFDLTLPSVYVPLVTGNTIFIYPGINKGLLMEEVFAHNRAEVIIATPSHLKLLLNKDLAGSGVKRIIIAGERFETALAFKISEKYNHQIAIYNLYGPTEATVGVTIHGYRVGHDNRTDLPIGLPTDNNEVYVLDPNLNALPVGAVGELHIAGRNLARGYLNNAALTAEKFVPYAYAPEKRIYRTGDLARGLPGGNIEFLGRIDNQVKIRGFRIEPEEIERTLCGRSDIDQVIVLAKGREGDKYLAAYYTANQEIEAAELSSYLSTKLPGYMVPACYVYLASMPTTASGKIDKRALPEPHFKMSTDHVPPADQIEEKLTRIWADALHIAPGLISMMQSFFELGGHSLTAILLANKISKGFGKEIPLSEIFTRQTIRAMAAGLRDGDSPVQSEAELLVNDSLRSLTVPAQEEYHEVSYLQKREFITSRINPGYTYNSYFSFAFAAYDKALLEKAVASVIERHESLRSVIVVVEGKVMQKVYPVKHPAFAIEYRSLVGEADVAGMLAAIERESSGKVFSFEQGPLMDLKVVQVSAEQSMLFFSMPHANVDGRSLAIIQEELLLLYEAFSEGKELALKPLRFQYKEYALWNNQLLAGRLGKLCKRYYQDKIGESLSAEKALRAAAAPPAPEQSYRRQLEKEIQHHVGAGGISDFAEAFGLIGRISAYTGGAYTFFIENHSLAGINRLAHASGNSLFTPLLAAFGLLLADASGSRFQRIEVPMTTRISEDFDPIVGWLMGGMILCLEVDEEATVGDYIKNLANVIAETSRYRYYSLEKVLRDFDLPINCVVGAQVNFMRKEETLESFAPFHTPEVGIYFSLSCIMMEYKNGLGLRVSYDKDRFKPAEIERFLEKYLRILNSEYLDLHQPVKNLLYTSDRPLPSRVPGTGHYAY